MESIICLCFLHSHPSPLLLFSALTHSPPNCHLVMYTCERGQRGNRARARSPARDALPYVVNSKSFMLKACSFSHHSLVHEQLSRFGNSASYANPATAGPGQVQGSDGSVKQNIWPEMIIGSFCSLDSSEECEVFKR